MIIRACLTACLVVSLPLLDEQDAARANPVAAPALASSKAAPDDVARASVTSASIRPNRRHEGPRLRENATRSIRPARTVQPQLYSWMSPEIAEAWNQGFRGQGSTIISVDDFSSSRFLSGNLGTGTQSLRHGEWVRLEGSLLAPSASLTAHDFASGRSVSVAKGGVSIANLSYGMVAKSGYSLDRIVWSAQEGSLISYAQGGNALVVKAAGNDAVAVGKANRSGHVDYLNVALIGAGSAIFVGALDRNGSPESKASLAGYSNFAGSDSLVQQRFITVGVRGDLTALHGTSFAAPVISGYAAVLATKFTSATPIELGNRLLETARTDTITGYEAAIHGRGESSIARALAPTWLRQASRRDN